MQTSISKIHLFFSCRSPTTMQATWPPPPMFLPLVFFEIQMDFYPSILLLFRCPHFLCMYEGYGKKFTRE
eukprot:c28289_g1_i2 orf=227-436(+)